MRIKRLKISNFKSVKDLEFQCSRVNILIGPPNSGKSNILESLSLISWMQHVPGGYGKFDNEHAFEWLRVKECPQLFHYYDTSSQQIKIEATLTPTEDGRDRTVDMTVESIGKETFRFSYAGKVGGGHVSIVFSPDFSHVEFKQKYIKQEHIFIRFYRYPPVLEERLTAGVRNLLPPIGRNISEVFLSGENKRLMKAVEPMLEELGFELVLEPERYAFQMKLSGKRVIPFEPYQVSDTFKRMLFHLAAVLTNDDSVVALEEPEAHAFPEYLVTLSEQIALSNNQFFITTHSPEVIYTLATKAEEARKGDFSCFLVSFSRKERRTRLKKLDSGTVRDYATSILANLDDFMEEE